MDPSQEGQAQQGAVNGAEGANPYEGWTPEQIAYYQQYYAAGYDYSQYYQQGQPAADGSTDPNQAAAAYADPNAYAGYYNNAAYAPQPAYNAFPAQPAFGMNMNAGGGQQEPTRSVWVGSLHPETTDFDLQNIFGRFGMIEHVKLLHGKQCAFVQFFDLESALKAHQGMMGQAINGQSVRLGWGRADPPRENRLDKEEQSNPPCKNLWLGNLSQDISEDHIRNAFARFGNIEKIRTLPGKNCAFVNFSTVEMANNAKKAMAGQYLMDRPLRINFGKDNQAEKQAAVAAVFDPLGERSKTHIEMPPPYSAPPNDPTIVQVIDKLAEYVASNGTEFEDLTASKQKDNPKFAFLDNNHPDHAYYVFKLWTAKYPGVNPNEVVAQHQLMQQQRLQQQQQLQPPQDDRNGYKEENNQNNQNFPPHQPSGPYSAVPPPTSNYSAPQQPNYAPNLNNYSGQQQGFSHQQPQQNDLAIPQATQLLQALLGTAPNPQTGYSSGYNNQNPPSNGALNEQSNSSANGSVLAELKGLMDSLVPKKDVIRSTKTWIMARPQAAGEISRYLLNRLEIAKDFDTKLNILYLIHDVLINSGRNRGPTERSDVFSASFRPFMKSIVLNIMRSALNGEGREKVTKVMGIWDEKSIYEPEFIKQLDKEDEYPARDSRFSDRDYRDPRDRDYRERDRGERDRDYNRDSRYGGRDSGRSSDRGSKWSDDRYDSRYNERDDRSSKRGRING
eukprot:TRINITY_DN188_c0_g1_i2.p1 TRINITY_DN188_c0_g1~~TRINITY_DN188_c0_g1_i2.p1  ORF type:complete len:729 (-),score=207.02 TRINITY_DN188_c0_g1_i2:703-2889(-)